MRALVLRVLGCTARSLLLAALAVLVRRTRR
jgi:hypothetical protein